MNKTFQDGLQLAQQIAEHQHQVAHSNNPTIILIPPFIHLEAISHVIAPLAHLALGAQNCHEQPMGAYTGEISVPLLASTGVQYVLVGHSERRQYHQEGHALLAQKVDAVLQGKLQPIFCCGEPREIRESHQHLAFITQQLSESLFHLAYAQVQQLIIAYEPVWSIGTGRIPSLADIHEMQLHIRQVIAQQYDPHLAHQLPILYGGSCNADNIQQIVSIPGINGALIGGASLHLTEFIRILSCLTNKLNN
eukprot:gene279-364_t